MLTALLVSLFGLSGLTLVRIERERASVTIDRVVARRNARSAVELALRVIANDSDWRNTYLNGQETAPQLIGSAANGTVSWLLKDSDGSLTDADTDLRLHGVGRVGNAVQVSSVKVISSGALDCLEVAACGNGLMSFFSSSITTTNQIVSSNYNVEHWSSTTLNSNVEAVGSVSGLGTITGTTTTPVRARTVPATSVFDYYIANGTAISITDIPWVGGKRTIRDVVLSPSNNPYGTTNPEGIYVINCAGALIRVRYSRIIGTLVLINPDSSSAIGNVVSWEPAVANYPALLVQGDIDNLRSLETPLDEAARGVNFNPAGSPYQGSTDSDQTDSYPSLIKGIVYVSGSLGINDHPHIDGVLITGDELNVFSGESLTITYDPLYMSDPPPGFEDPSLSPVPGSWLWDAAP